MDKAFWQAILDADGAVPEGYAVAELTPELLALLGSTDLAMEDERLANAVWAALRRDLLGLPFLSTWLSRLARPFQETPRSEVVTDVHKTNAFHNTRLFLHSLYFQLVLGVRPPPWYTDTSFFMGAPALRDDLLPLVVGTLRAIDPGFYAKG